MNRVSCGFGVGLLALLTACSEPPPGGRPAQPADPAATTPAVSQPLAAAAPSASPVGQAVDAAAWPPQASDASAAQPALIRAQVLLDRARFSPGVIDGRAGENLRQAVAAFEQAHQLPVDGQLDPAVFGALTQADGQPAMQDYTITAADVAGPFVAEIPTDYEAMAKLKTLAYSGPAELLAEKFHMDEALLRSLNPNTDFTRAGAVIVVARPAPAALPGAVARIEVDKAEREVRAFDAAGALLAVYPATVGSADRPAPSGEWEVRAIAPEPTWSYDPKRLTFGKIGEKMTIAAGPNNPVGSIWIDLTKDTYGIHGTPDPAKVGKAESHGCVRLTNWDAEALGSAVKPGTKVVFVGAESKIGKA
jgi:lipoprotein-anchoring transpeptidase ErfK/SrfK